MTGKKLFLLIAGLALPLTSFASPEKPVLTSSESTTTEETHCPNPNRLSFNKWPTNGWHARDEKGIDWYSETHHSAPQRGNAPTIKFLEARIMTANGNNTDSASPHIVCTYKISSFEEILTMQPTDFTRVLSTKILSQSPNWQYLPHQGEDSFGEWRCTKNSFDCRFELTLEKTQHTNYPIWIW